MLQLLGALPRGQLAMICVFGNAYLAQDNLALAVAKELNVPVRHCTSPEQLLDMDDIIILDVVKNITQPLLLSPNQIKARNIMSMHDFDVGFFLKLMQELDMKKNIIIIGLPQEGDAVQLAQQVKAWI
ncbi:MAG: hypothetical protein V1725_01095 [archaeon]